MINKSAFNCKFRKLNTCGNQETWLVYKFLGHRKILNPHKVLGPHKILSLPRDLSPHGVITLIGFWVLREFWVLLGPCVFIAS